MILITGANGYIAGFLIKELCSNHQIVGIDLHEKAEYKTNDECLYVKCDIRSLDELNNLMSKYQIDLVIHLAALLSVQESIEFPDMYYETNVVGTRNVIAMMQKYHIKKIIFSSTCAIFDDLPADSKIGVGEDQKINPRSPYAQQKIINEVDIEKSSIDYIIFRFFNVVGGKLGKDFSLFGNTIRRLNRHERPIIYGSNHPTRDGTTVRDYIHPTDLANAHLMVMSNFDQVKNNKFNLGSSNAYTTKEIVSKICSTMGKPFDPEYREPRQETVVMFSDTSKINSMLGWKTTFNLEDITNSVLDSIQ